MPPERIHSMKGRVAVVTGGTSGIGLEIARGLATRGAHTVVVGRRPDRLQQVVQEIRESSGNPRVEGVPVADLAFRSSWRQVAQELERRFPAIHVVVHNAGAIFTRREVTPDGIERTFALNVLAPLAITSFLQDRLRASAPARVVNVASAAHEGFHVDPDNLQSEGHYGGFQTYGRSKLALILLSRELALRFAGSGVTVNSLHPGFIRSGFARNNRGGTAAAIRVASLLVGRSPKKGAETPIRVICDPEWEHVSGEYFSHGHVATGSAASRDLAVARDLYERCLPLTGAPEVRLPSGLTRPAR
ncbi:MAG: SDR family oxidoreductase [Thermoplasmata archaeon]|nr:SDR family oxidoreductase [Thermoplasmata archaeon]